MKKEIEKFKSIHGDAYDYSLVNYINNITKIEIICKIHGVFEQTPHHHKRGGGCGKCTKGAPSLSKDDFIKKSVSKHGNLYDYSLVNYINETQKTFDDCVYKKKLRFDFYLPEYNTCIEYNGIQHYGEVKAFGGHSYLLDIKTKDNIKVNYCNNMNINLIVIKYTDFENISNIISNYISL